MLFRRSTIIDPYAEYLELCDLCGEPLDADNCYGSEEMPLCRYHHEKLDETLTYLLGQGGQALDETGEIK